MIRNLLRRHDLPAAKIVLVILFTMNLGFEPSTFATENPTGFLGSLQPHRSSYFLNSWFMESEGSEQGYQNQEMLIRLSVKVEIITPFYFGYSHKAFWQVFDLDNSRPFREQNYNPELFADLGPLFDLDRVLLGLMEHESNGEQMRFDENGAPVNYSRTWDRTYLFLEKKLTENLMLSAKAWIVTSPKRDEYRAYYDDNPDMQQYMGSGELYLHMTLGKATGNLMFRHGWKENTETFQLDVHFPLSDITGKIADDYTLHFQAFSGYGDSLIDYNRKVTRMAAGIGLW